MKILNTIVRYAKSFFSGATLWPEDIADMHSKFGVNPIVNKLTSKQLNAYLKFRLDMSQEEQNEAYAAFENKDPDGIVDAIIDGIVFNIGTLNALGINPYEAWNRVHAANMAKYPGVKPGRPNPFGFPDLIKPENWTAPTHKDNVGLIPRAFE